MKKFFHIIVAILNIIAAVSLALACLCCYISPKTTWWIAFFGLAYLHLFTINICFAAFWMFLRRKKLILLSLAVILTGCPFAGRHIRFFEKKLPENRVEESVMALSFNVQGFLQMNSTGPDGKKLNIFDFIREKNADIVCMQEFAIAPEKGLNEKSILRRIGKMPFCHMELTAGSFGIATFSKYPIVRKQLIYSDNTTNACMCSDLLIGTDTVRVYNVHLKSIGFNENEWYLINNAVKRDYNGQDVRAVKAIIRQMSVSSFNRARQVDILATHIAQATCPVIICGDFNDPPASYSYRKVRGSLKDAFIEAGSGRGTTYNIGNISSQRIDYTLYSGVFRAYDYESPRVRLSDHFPVMCRLVKRQ